MQQYEVEIKSLLGNKDKADALISKMQTEPGFQTLGAHKQLNHYFTNGDLKRLHENLLEYIDPSKLDLFKKLTEEAKDYSIRTRWADGKVLFVMKASVDDTTSSNGTARMEFESQVNLSLEELDKIILGSGFEYLSKWSREREDFKFKNLNVSIDKNAGYGYLAEFESVIEDQTKADETKSLIRGIMTELGIEELNQERLARMFDFYNKNWPDYYGTEKTFVIE